MEGIRDTFLKKWYFKNLKKVELLSILKLHIHASIILTSVKTLHLSVENGMIKCLRRIKKSLSILTLIKYHFSMGVFHVFQMILNRAKRHI